MRTRILLLSTPDYGHAAPLLKVAQSLHSDSTDVLFVTSESSPVRGQGSSFRIKRLKDGIDEYSRACAYDMKSFSPHRFVWMRSHMLSEARKIAQEFKPHLIIGDYTTFAAHELSKLLKVPLVIVVPGSKKFVVERCAVWGLAWRQQLMKFRLIRKQIIHAGCMLESLCGRKTLVWVRNQIYLFQLSQTLLHPTLFLSCSVFDSTSWMFTRHACVMPIRTLEPAVQGDCVVSKGTASGDVRKKILIALGSQPRMSESQVTLLAQEINKIANCFDFVEVVWALHAEGQKHITPLDLHCRVALHEWVDQAKLLASGEVACFISHCGWASCLETITYGVPVVTFPFTADQPSNADLLCKLGIALCSEQYGICRAVQLVMNDQNFADRAAKLSRQLRPYLSQEEPLLRTVTNLLEC